MSRYTRRDLLKSAAVAGLATNVTIAGTSASGKLLGANEKLRLGVVGCGGRGGAHVGAFAGNDDCQVTYLVDPDMRRAEGRKKSVKDRGGNEPKCVADVREALDDKNLDAISVATPNHWHSLMVIWSAEAGKHCYVEKPASHDIHEGRVALEAWKKYGTVVQHGTQQRSDARRAAQMKAIRDGKFGKLKIAYGYCCKPRGGIGFKQPSDPPENLDWNMWCGPAVIEQYHGNYHPYNWHWFWETGNGDLNNQGTHQLDVAQWAIDEDQTHPVRAMALGNRFQWDDQGETPNTMFAIAEYPNGQYVFFNVRNVNFKGYPRQVMNEFYFEDGGWMDDRGTYYPKGSDKGERVDFPAVEITDGGTFGAFVKAARAGKPEMSNADMKAAHYSCVVGHLMNNSYRIGKPAPFNEKALDSDMPEAREHFLKLHKMMRDGVGIKENEAQYMVGPWLTFDPDKEQFTGDHAEEANKLVFDPQRPGFEIPAVDKV